MSRHRNFHRAACAVFAALSLCALCGCGDTAVIKDKAGLITQVNLELDTLRALGVFTAEFEAAEDDSVPDFEYEGHARPWPELPENRYEGVISLNGYYETGNKYSYDIDVDTETGKITGLEINAKPQENWVPTSVSFRGAPSSSLLGFYDNFEALFDPDMTLGQLCSGWARYQGYESYELPEGAADETAFTGARELAAWDIGYDGGIGGITAAFYRGGEREPEYYRFTCTPAAAGPYFVIRPAEGPYVPEEHTPTRVKELPEATGERSAAALINAELNKLRALGLLQMDFEVTAKQLEHSGVTGGRIDEKYTGKVHVNSGIELDNCNYYLCYDAGSGKLDCLAVCPKPADGSLSVPDVYSGYGAVMDEDITIGEYCRLWAEYQGYESYELPEGVGEDTRFFDAHTLAAWDGGIAGYDIDGLTVSFYRAGSDEAEYAYVKYGPSGIGPCVALGSDFVQWR